MSETAKPPLPLMLAAILAGLQSLFLIGLAIEVFFDVSKENLKISSGVGLLLLLLGVGLGAAAIGVARSAHIARGPVIVAQLISLGLAWNLFKTDEELPGVEIVGVVLVILAAIVLVALATPSAREALADRPVNQ